VRLLVELVEVATAPQVVVAGDPNAGASTSMVIVSGV
jgi:GTP1/Obg family GTP-binding protein